MALNFFVLLSSLLEFSLGAPGWTLPTLPGRNDGPNHWTNIGMPALIRPEDHINVMEHKDTEVIGDPSPGHQGYYTRLCSKSGAQLWNYVDENNDCSCFDPHFEGKSRMQIYIESKIEPGFMEGGFEGWANGGVQLDFYCPDYWHAKRDLNLPASVTVQMAAFAHEIDIHASVEDYYQDCDQKGQTGLIFEDGKPQGGSMRLSAQSFFKFSLVQENKPFYAIFTGVITHAEEKRNELTGMTFYLVQVKSLCDTEFDVVIHPDQVAMTGCLPQKGGVVNGLFWLSGRLLPEVEDVSSNKMK